MSAKAFRCLRCGNDMRYMGTEKFQLGRAGVFFPDLPHILAGVIELSIYLCPQCGKVEFFAPPDTPLQEDAHSVSGLPQVTCPRCGKPHDFDYPQCPFCKFDYRISPLTSRASAPEADIPTPQVCCPSCGAIHDFDLPQCPVCRYDYSREDPKNS